MKTKLNFNLGAVSIGEIEVKDISMNVEFENTSKEMFDMYKLMKMMIKDTPEVLEDLKSGYDTFNRINNEVEQETKKSNPDWKITSVENETVTQDEVKQMFMESIINNFR